MQPELLVAASAAIIGLLGLGHLVLTFWGSRLAPRDRSLVDAMERAVPVLTSKTTIWKMWTGFNASHSIGLMLFGLSYGYLALTEPEFLFQSAFLQALGLAVLVGYVFLARRYWFITPLAGTGLALLLFIVAIGIARFG